MLNEHYDVTTAAYAVGYESYPISVGNIRGCLESHPREILHSARQFPTTGSTSPAVPFQITLSECSKGTTGVRVAFNGIEDAENNTLLKLDEGSNTASGLGIEILDGNMRPVKLNDLHAGMQWIPLVPEQNNILPYSARLKSTQKSVNPGLVRASATFTLEFQ